IVFVNPPLSLAERYGVTFKSGGETPPLGLAWLAAVCRKNGFEPLIVDGPALHLTAQQTADKVLSYKPDYVGLTAANISIERAGQIAEFIKNAASDKIKIIIGGPHLTSVPERTMQLFPHFDIGVIGEGEVTIVELLQALAGGRGPEQVKGLIIRKNGALLRTGVRPLIQHLDELPMPAWDLLPDLKTFYCPPVHTVKCFPAALLVPSRGCPYQCTFCDRSVFGNRYRIFSVDYVIRMVRDLYDNYGIREIQFRDDNLTVNRQYLTELCTRLLAEPIKICWSCVGRVNTIDPELLRLMKRSGCWSISYGIESGSQRILDEIKKGTTLAQIKQAINWTAQAGISTVGFFMAGLPGENAESMAATIKLVKELPLSEFHMTFFTPHPGTAVYPIADHYGVFTEDWKKMSEWYPVFIPTGLTKEELVKYVKRANATFYFRPRIIVNYLKKIKSWRHLAVYFSGFLSFMQSLLVKKY
ncbi:MAG TPA: radical SAM protein, partial [Candidatus Sulfotelmatobacter sp.]|nr:radical SAM protein [Candidatus Sulfotelmatobacter sp.]